MRRFELTDLQAESILNMRLRSLRKLEEIEIRKEFDNFTAEKADVEALLASDEKQWATVSWEISEVKKKFGKDTKLGRRRTIFGDAPETDIEAIPAGDDRKGAGDGGDLAKGLDPRHEGASVGHVVIDLQGR